MSLLSNLTTAINAASTEFKDVLPAINTVVSDMVSDYAAWQANPVVKASEAVVTIMNPVAVLDIQAAIGAASLVQALWQVFGAGTVSNTAVTTTPATTPIPSPTPAAVVVPTAEAQEEPVNLAPQTLQEAVAANGGQIPDQQPSHM